MICYITVIEVKLEQSKSLHLCRTCYILNNCTLILIGSYFVNKNNLRMQDYQFGSILIENSFDILIKNNNFYKNQNSLFGGCITSKNNPFPSRLIIEKNYFYENKAVLKVGVIYIEKTKFYHSLEIACSKKGGVIYFEVKSFPKKFIKYKLNILEGILTVEKSIFCSNSASKEEGAIKWSKNQPIISENSRFNSNGAAYGNLTAAFPIKLRIVIRDPSN